MKVYCVRTGLLQTNTYILDCGGGAAAVIDPADAAPVYEELEANGLTAVAVLLTHGHFDHIGGAAELQAAGAKVYVHKDDADMLEGKGGSMVWMRRAKVAPLTADELLCGGERLKIGETELTVLHTPGHTPGGVCYIAEHELFSGDTLFCGSVGRSDLEGGDYTALMDSVRTKLMRLRGDYKVYPGHGRFTSLDRERAENPYVKG